MAVPTSANVIEGLIEPLPLYVHQARDASTYNVGPITYTFEFAGLELSSFYLKLHGYVPSNSIRDALQTNPSEAYMIRFYPVRPGTSYEQAPESIVNKLATLAGKTYNCAVYGPLAPNVDQMLPPEELPELHSLIADIAAADTGPVTEMLKLLIYRYQGLAYQVLRGKNTESSDALLEMLNGLTALGVAIAFMPITTKDKTPFVPVFSWMMQIAVNFRFGCQVSNLVGAYKNAIDASFEDVARRRGAGSINPKRLGDNTYWFYSPDTYTRILASKVNFARQPLLPPPVLLMQSVFEFPREIIRQSLYTSTADGFLPVGVKKGAWAPMNFFMAADTAPPGNGWVNNETDVLTRRLAINYEQQEGVLDVYGLDSVYNRSSRPASAIMRTAGSQYLATPNPGALSSGIQPELVRAPANLVAQAAIVSGTNLVQNVTFGSTTRARTGAPPLEATQVIDYDDDDDGYALPAAQPLSPNTSIIRQAEDGFDLGQAPPQPMPTMSRPASVLLPSVAALQARAQAESSQARTYTLVQPTTPVGDQTGLLSTITGAVSGFASRIGSRLMGTTAVPPAPRAPQFSQGPTGQAANDAFRAGYLIALRPTTVLSNPAVWDARVAFRTEKSIKNTIYMLKD